MGGVVETTTPLERAARALCERDGRDPDEMFGAANAEYPLWHLHRDDVRAVLSAIREPSERMLEVGEHEYQQTEIGVIDDLTSRHTWRAMIDALLAEELTQK